MPVRTHLLRTVRLTALGLIAASLAACGGGYGDEESTPEPPAAPPTTQSSSAEPAAATAVAASAASEVTETTTDPVAERAGGATDTLDDEVVALRLSVQGMHCGGCASTVQSTVSKLDGVVGCEVSFDQSSASVQLDDAERTDAVLDAIKSLGYEVTVVVVES